jgi:membrane protease YdiL (CAAX protease family)
MPEELPVKESHFDVGGVIILYLGFVVLLELIDGIRRSIPRLNGNSWVWTYESALSLLTVILVSLALRPHILALSRWKPTWKDAAIGLPAGILASVAPLFFAADPSRYLQASPHYFVVPVLLLGPFLEESFCRGILLKSLRSCQPVWVAIPAVVFMTALIHQYFWFAIWAQLVLCLVYIVLGNSLAGSIICHISANAILFFPLAKLFTKTH